MSNQPLRGGGQGGFEGGVWWGLCLTNPPQGYRTIIARYIANWGIARMFPRETKYQKKGVSNNFGGVLTISSKVSRDMLLSPALQKTFMDFFLPTCLAILHRKMAGIFGEFFCGVRLPRNEARKLLKKFRENSEQNSGQNSGWKFEKFGKLSFCNFSDLTIWGIAAIVSQYCAMWGHYAQGKQKVLEKDAFFSLCQPLVCPKPWVTRDLRFPWAPETH